MTQLDAHEVARRIRAAISYAGLKQSDLAADLNISIRTLQRMMGAGGEEPRQQRRGDLFMIAELCGLPRAWFTADFARLSEIGEGPSFRSIGEDAGLAGPSRTIYVTPGEDVEPQDAESSSQDQYPALPPLPPVPLPHDTRPRRRRKAS